MSEDRHINFKLMRERILALQSRSEPPALAGGFSVDHPPANAGGSDKSKSYWRSLEELADAPEFREFVEREYPQHAEEWNDPLERRTFLKLMGASLALAGLSGEAPIIRVAAAGQVAAPRAGANAAGGRVLSQ